MVKDILVCMFIAYVEEGETIHCTKALGRLEQVDIDRIPEVGHTICMYGLDCEVITVDADFDDHPLFCLLLDSIIQDDQHEYSRAIEHVINLGMQVEEI